MSWREVWSPSWNGVEKDRRGGWKVYNHLTSMLHICHLCLQAWEGQRVVASFAFNKILEPRWKKCIALYNISHPHPLESSRCSCFDIRITITYNRSRAYPSTSGYRRFVECHPPITLPLPERRLPSKVISDDGQGSSHRDTVHHSGVLSSPQVCESGPFSAHWH